ncbi:transcription initiation factor tfiid subunit 8 [Moniliophthora roreri MCA 2997]|uniref:Transcription initiation factor TFIID subunit 8 n=2 Tax=Moniliophthora roreri TaxID=221103 RepID=V2XX62_MONRO|nr:transcription initiation factor tfiid subunit 8 [Moniliophthora roreri MCA 2997]KAI3612394.1 transcription initiation factor tfiid subunit 8 [Moniliophthora roreri]
MSTSINPYPIIPASAFTNLTAQTTAAASTNVQKPPAPYYPTFPHLQLQAQQQPQEPPRPPSPVQPAVTPEIASNCIRKLISSELKGAHFDGAQPAAVERLEKEVVAFVQRLYQRAHEYADLSNRSGPVATDLLRTCDDYGLSTEQLRAVKAKTMKRKRKAPETVQPSALVPLESRSPSPELLPSDDEDVPQIIPATIRTLPNTYPSLPPKHTYLQTPASPPRKAALPSLEKKLKTAGLVQESLKNLLIATEDNDNQEDAELLGHIVNWEVNIRPRKKWRVDKH